ncbi:hypothetical protein [Flavobacterium sp.]|uniref:hypothetical protein n=1 Tax=Flavobacterium sp. TaxID=239 RepID=UPI000ED27B43|nr:hypothetical protein [Flavobacterium sp.]HCQ11836.1 hypothetical protein [Flavobacterium sp.]
MKKYLLLLPEFFIIALSIYWFLENYMGSGYVNYIALVVFVIVTLQVFLKNKIVGIMLGSILFLFGLYMVLAVLSEFRKFTSIDSSAIQLISVGFLICFVLISSSIGLIYKSIPKPF